MAKIDPTKKRITQTELARMAGVSQITIHRVVSNHPDVRPRTREKVLKLLEKYNYRLNSSASSMRSGRTRQIGVLLLNSPDDEYSKFTNPRAFETILGINDELARGGYLLSLVRIGEFREEGSFSRVFREQLLEGIIIMDTIPKEICQMVEDRINHCVWLETNEWKDTNCIRVDEERAGWLAADALINAGYRDLIWLGRTAEGRDVHYSRTDRFEGVRRRVTDSGASLESVWLPWSEFSSAMKPELLARINRKEVGVIAYDLMLAQRLTSACGVSGCFPGRDFGLICCDSSYEISRTWPKLARIRHNRYDLGVRAAKMMLSLCEDGEARVGSQSVECECFSGATALPIP